MQKILVTEPLHEAGIRELEQRFLTLKSIWGCPPRSWRSEIGGYDAIITRSGTAVTPQPARSGCGRLRVVGRAGIGVDNIDINAATARGIAVVNAPNGNVRAAAEHTIALIFALSRNIPQAAQSAPRRRVGQEPLHGHRDSGQDTGHHRPGQSGHAGGPPRDGARYGSDRLSIPSSSKGRMFRWWRSMISCAMPTIVTLHVPLTAITANMIGEREIELMKRSAFLINCARGKVVDETALYRCLQERDGSRARRSTSSPASR